VRRRKFVAMGVGSGVLLGAGPVWARKKEKTMLLSAKVPPFNSTLMGMVRGVADFYGIKLSDPMLYGASGHAFMINIHETLCPSGPYCWKREHFYALLPNLGLSMKDEGFVGGDVTAEKRAATDSLLRKHLDSQNPCGLVNMEYQLIWGYDETGFLTSQPWAPHNDFPPKHLTFGTWDEFGKEIHVNFFTFRKTKPAAMRDMVLAGLRHGLDIHANPAKHTSAPYATGAAAYDAFIAAVKAGHGGDHGNWWNATVWAECRDMAGKFLREIAPSFAPVKAELEALGDDYLFISAMLGKASDKAVAAEPKIALLEQARAREVAAIAKLGDVVAKM
jgi:hypothetical protein